jgi:hypothetical protein
VVRDRATELAELEPADLKTVLNYGRSLALRSLHQQGALGELPEFLLDKSAARVRVEPPS